MTQNPPRIKAITQPRTISEGTDSAVRIQRIIGQRRAGQWYEPTPFAGHTRPPLRSIKPARPLTAESLLLNKAPSGGCAPGMGCHRLPECKDLHCPGHPVNNPSTTPARHQAGSDVDQNARAMFWRAYIGGVFAVVFAGLYLWLA